MSIAARAISSRAVSSISLAGITTVERRARCTRGSGPPARPPPPPPPPPPLPAAPPPPLPRAARPPAPRHARPLLEIRGLVLHAELHGDGVDERLELVAEGERHLPCVVPRLDHRRDVAPGHDLPAGHLTGHP